MNTVTTVPIQYNVAYTVSARDLVESGLFYAGDQNPSHEASPEERHETLIACMKRKYEDCHERFVTSVLENGNHKPIAIQFGDMFNPDYFEITNGHHRLAIVYYHNLPVKVIIFSNSEERFEYRFEATGSSIYSDGYPEDARWAGII
jgi:hypothetical protein